MHPIYSNQNLHYTVGQSGETDPIQAATDAQLQDFINQQRPAVQQQAVQQQASQVVQQQASQAAALPQAAASRNQNVLREARNVLEGGLKARNKLDAIEKLIEKGDELYEGVKAELGTAKQEIESLNRQLNTKEAEIARLRTMLDEGKISQPECRKTLWGVVGAALGAGGVGAAWYFNSKKK